MVLPHFESHVRRGSSIHQNS